MENNYNNWNPTFTPAFTDRDKQPYMLYQDIRDYFGWSANREETASPTGMIRLKTSII
ncbi:MAG: hypothetical protein ACHQHN_10515 [Sphingobacteriales bacterium]